MTIYVSDLSRINGGKSLLQINNGLQKKPVDWIDESILQLSEHPDIDVRGKVLYALLSLRLQWNLRIKDT